MASGDDWDRRILCSDGNCIGIIGEDGNCRECGKPYAGEEPLPASPGAADDEGPDKTGAVRNDSIDNPSGEEPTKDDWEDRRLCIDESCIGVVGPDGCCKACGKPCTD